MSESISDASAISSFLDFFSSNFLKEGFSYILKSKVTEKKLSLKVALLSSYQLISIGKIKTQQIYTWGQVFFYY